MAIRHRTDLSAWLGSEAVQHYLPHEMILVIWGSPGTSLVHHDLITSSSPESGDINRDHFDAGYPQTLLDSHLVRWIKGGRKPYVLQEVGASGFLLKNENRTDPRILSRRIQPALIHGICDKRSNQDYLYVLSGSRPGLERKTAREVIMLLLPYIDTTLRQITPLSHQRLSCLIQSRTHQEEPSLSEREIEIMDWVKIGKTNPEIAEILEISSYTVKNHLHHIFKKLSVCNRVQAICRFEQHHG